MTVMGLLTLLTVITNAQQTLDFARRKATAFTRKRGMTFADAISFLLDMRKTSLQTRLNYFFYQTKGGGSITQQAFSKLRKNFDHSPFETMVRTVVKEEYSGRHELPLWHGYHVFAVDGSHLQLPRVDALRREFGVIGRGGTCPAAGISVLFDVLHGWVLDPAITNAKMNERVMCEGHVEFLQRELPHLVEKSIVLMDRGYPSADLFAKLQESGVKFLIRCSDKFLSEINDAPICDSIVTLKNGLSIRVFKFELPSGEIETLATNLSDLPQELLPELYSLRWGVETAYFRLKRQLCVENFSGKTPNTIRQDFWANMVLLNSVAVFQKEADDVVEERQPPNAKYKAKARTSGIIVTLRDRFIFAVLCGVPGFAEKEIADVIHTMARELSFIRPGRSFPRDFKPVYAANHNLKSVL
jgi:hypothetical protein